MPALLSPAAQERLFFLGLGIGAFFAVKRMRELLIHYRDEAVLPPEEGKSQWITQGVEDSLKISTLDKLLDSPNYCIQETTAIIICERALHDNHSLNTILYYATRPDYETREKGIRTLTYVVNSGMLEISCGRIQR